MKPVRMGTCRFVSSAFLCQDMNNYRSFYPFCFIKEFHHLTHIMTVNRPQICQPHIFKQHSRNEKLLDTAFGFSHGIYQSSPYLRNFLQCLCHAHLHSCISFCSSQCAQISGHTSYISGNGHIIVIYDNNKICL